MKRRSSLKSPKKSQKATVTHSVKRKNSKNWGLFVIIILLAVLVLTGLYMLLLKSNEDLSTVDGIYAAVEKEMGYRYSDVGLTADTNSWVGDQKNGIPVEVTGYPYRVGSQAAPTIVFSLGEPQERSYRSFLILTHKPKRAYNIPEASKAVEAVMQRGGFKQTYNGEDRVLGLWHIVFEKNGMTCVRSDQGNAALTFTCYSQQIMLSVAAAAKPYVDSLINAGMKPDFSQYWVGAFEIKQPGVKPEYGQMLTASKTPGYDIAEFYLLQGLSSYSYSFYRKNGGDWNYATNGWSSDCNNLMRNPEVRKAFYDQICATGDKSYRRLDTDNSVE